MVVYAPQTYGAAARETTPSLSAIVIHAYLRATAALTVKRLKLDCTTDPVIMLAMRGADTGCMRGNQC